MNEHWEIINAGGRVVSATPEQLWQQGVDYFKWCDSNPIKAQKTMLSGKTQGQKVEVEYKRPYTIEGFCLHASISKRYIQDIQSMYGKDSEWYMVIQKIISVIYTQNLEGAIVELFNPIVVAKLLNLDKPQEDDSRSVRVEIIDTGKKILATSENEILSNLDYDMVDQFKNKLQEEQAKEHDKEHSA